MEAWVSLGWTERLPRLVSIGLFAYRLLGVVRVEIYGVRWLLFLFPNLFENWFLFVAGRDRFVPAFRLDMVRRVVTCLMALYIPKNGQEYLLHVAEAQP